MNENKSIVNVIIFLSFSPRSGPGAYNVPGMGASSMRRAYMESTRRGAFGSTAVRIQPISKKDAYMAPGPAHYQPKDKVEPKYQHKALTSNFASLTSRIPDGPGTVKVSEGVVE